MELVSRHLPQRQKRDLPLPSAWKNMLSIITEQRRRACAESWSEAAPSPATWALGLHHPEQLPPHGAALSHSGRCCQLLIARAQLPHCLSGRRRHSLPGWLLLPRIAPPCPSAMASTSNTWCLLYRWSNRARAVPQSCCSMSSGQKTHLSWVTMNPGDPCHPGCLQQPSFPLGSKTQMIQPAK